jgi:hypothetical protein
MKNIFILNTLIFFFSFLQNEPTRIKNLLGDNVDYIFVDCENIVVIPNYTKIKKITSNIKIIPKRDSLLYLYPPKYIGETPFLCFHYFNNKSDTLFLFAKKIGLKIEFVQDTSYKSISHIALKIKREMPKSYTVIPNETRLKILFELQYIKGTKVKIIKKTLVLKGKETILLIDRFPEMGYEQIVAMPQITRLDYKNSEKIIDCYNNIVFLE